MTEVVDLEEHLCRYSCFLCFAILASAAEGNHFKSIKAIKQSIEDSIHGEKIHHADFDKISFKSNGNI